MIKIFLVVLFFFPIVFCQADEKTFIDSLLNGWHKSAAIADQQTYFGIMSDECIFLGTDKTERWTKQEFELWSEPYFKRESAWNIYSVRRNIYFSENKTIAWFDEDLIAGISECRGSGVLIKRDNEWKIIQYNLALTVPNDLADDLRKLIEDFNDQQISKPE